MYDMDDSQHPELQEVAAHLSKQLDDFNRRGSGFVLDRITKFTICIAQYRPLHGSSYIATPQWLAKKRAVVNIKNTSDSKCFVWSVLAALHPGARDPNRVYIYKPQQNTLNTSGLTFPIPVKDIPKFEKQTPSISINVLCSGDEGGFVPLYVSKERDRLHHVNLFLREGPDDTRHHVWIKNMSRLVASRTNHQHHIFVCNHCLYPFRNKDTLDGHVNNCQRHPAQDVKYSDPKKPKNPFWNFANMRLGFVFLSI